MTLAGPLAAGPVVTLAGPLAAGPARALADLPVLATLRLAVLAPAPVLLAAARARRTRSWFACRSRILRTRQRSRAPVTLAAVAEVGLAALAQAARHVQAGPAVAPVRALAVVLVVLALVRPLRGNISF